MRTQCTLLLALSVGVLGSQCPAGYKHKTDLSGILCATNAEDAASCGDCCEKNLLTCGGLAANGQVSCAWNEYAAGDDAWKNKAATAKTAGTDCCQPKVSCANQYFKMPAGKKTKAGVAAVKCSSDAKSCTEGSMCLEDNLKSCGGFARNSGTAQKCGTGAPKGTDDAWLNTLRTTGADFDQNSFDTECCATYKKCDATGIVCKTAGKKVAGNSDCEATAEQVGGANSAPFKSAVLSDCGREGTGTCCTADDDKTCAGQIATTATLCTAGGKVNGAVSGTDTDAAYKAWAGKACDPSINGNCLAICCVAKAKCTQGTCKSGEKKSAAGLAAATECSGNVASCSGAECCVVDDKKCGGLSTGVGNVVSCGYGTFDERITWTSKTEQAVKDAWNNKAATSTNVNTNCCTAVAKCSLPTGTTTPAVVVVNVQVPALKFSQHKIATEGSRPVGTQMLWLGVGGLIGMSVIMAVQFLRSRQSAVQGAQLLEEDDSLLEQ